MDNSGAAENRQSVRTFLSPSGLVYSIFLLLLLAAELIVLTPPSEVVLRTEQASSWGRQLSTVLHQIRPAFVTGLLAVVFLSWPRLKEELREASAQSERAARSILWLAVHLMLVGILLTAKALGATGSVNSVAETSVWLWLWAAMALPVVATWAMAAMPLRFWRGWLTRSRGALLAGLLFGGAADFLGGSTEVLWWPVQRLSFILVVHLLRMFGQAAIVDPERFTVGTPHFAVRIWPACSGLEGVGLISAYLGAYVWLFRRELQWPQALLLLPIGAVVTWLMNAVRLTTLILLGGWNTGVGFKGFHSMAGWLFFNLIACGLIWTSWSCSFFNKSGERHLARSGPNPAAVYLVPLLAVISVSMIARGFSAGFEVSYSLRVFAALGAFWLYRRELAVMQWRASAFAFLLGAGVFLLWIGLTRGHSVPAPAAYAAIGTLPNDGNGGALLFRMAGSITVAPLAEELAFRGYLIRKLVAADFASVSPARFTWASFVGSSVLFGALHTHWIAATLAGMTFAIALYRRGFLSDAVVAHATSNGLLCAYIVATGSWELWT